MLVSPLFGKQVVEIYDRAISHMEDVVLSDHRIKSDEQFQNERRLERFLVWTTVLFNLSSPMNSPSGKLLPDTREPNHHTVTVWLVVTLEANDEDPLVGEVTKSQKSAIWT